MTHPVDLTCSICGDTAVHEFATQEAKNEFLKLWAKYHPAEEHKSYAKTVELSEKRRARRAERLP